MGPRHWAVAGRCLPGLRPPATATLFPGRAGTATGPGATFPGGQHSSTHPGAPHGDHGSEHSSPISSGWSSTKSKPLRGGRSRETGSCFQCGVVAARGADVCGREAAAVLGAPTRCAPRGFCSRGPLSGPAREQPFAGHCFCGRDKNGSWLGNVVLQCLLRTGTVPVLPPSVRRPHSDPSRAQGTRQGAREHRLPGGEPWRTTPSSVRPRLRHWTCGL